MVHSATEIIIHALMHRCCT